MNATADRYFRSTDPPGPSHRMKLRAYRDSQKCSVMIRALTSRVKAPHGERSACDRHAPHRSSKSLRRDDFCCTVRPQCKQCKWPVDSVARRSRDRSLTNNRRPTPYRLSQNPSAHASNDRDAHQATLELSSSPKIVAEGRPPDLDQLTSVPTGQITLQRCSRRHHQRRANARSCEPQTIGYLLHSARTDRLGHHQPPGLTTPGCDRLRRGRTKRPRRDGLQSPDWFLDATIVLRTRYASSVVHL